jgi:hypothetical protein
VTKSLHSEIHGCEFTSDMSRSVLSLRKVGLRKETHNTEFPSSICRHGSRVQSSQLDKPQQLSMEKQEARPVENEESCDSCSNF